MQSLKRFLVFFSLEALQLKHRLLVLILFVGLIQGLFYVFLIPPWWHYDEPGHFEFAWQIVHFDHWPRFNEFDEAMRRKVAASMMRYQYYEVMNYQPDLTSKDPVFIGAAPQTTNYPLYYLIASLPLRVLRNADFAIQNIAVRLMSLVMFLLTLWVAWNALGELFHPDHPVQWMTVLFMALLPGFVDTMTAISDDVGAVLVFSVFVWMSLRILRRGLTFSRLVALIISLALCYWTKDTTWPALVLAPIVILFAVFRGRYGWIAWAGMAFVAVAGILFALRLDDAALWYRGKTQIQSIRTRNVSTTLGDYAFSLHYQQEQSPWIGQFISSSQMQSLRGGTATLGVWMWADQPIEIRLPGLRATLYNSNQSAGIATMFGLLDKDTREMLSQGICSACYLEIKKTIDDRAKNPDAGTLFVSPAQNATLTTTPSFYSITFDIPFEAERGWLEVVPFPDEAADKGNATIYFDGIVLTQGKRQGIPQFDTVSAQSGTWDGKHFENVLRNASAESVWLRPSSQVDEILKKIFSSKKIFSRGDPDVFLASLQDWQGAGFYYRAAATSLFRTFWAATARAKVQLLGGNPPYEILQWVTALGLLGAAILAARRFRYLSWNILAFFGLVLLSIWGLAVARGGVVLLRPVGVIPWARYAFPSIIPTAVLLCLGWGETLHWLGKVLKISVRQQAWIFVSFLVGLDILAMLSIARYFYWKDGQEYLALFIALPVAVLLGLILWDKKSSLPATPNEG